jgi:hypothetical protein
MDVVKHTWKYVKKEYHLRGTPGGSHIWIMPTEPYTLSESKRIAQAIIHFEPTLHALVPDNVGDPNPPKRNWRNSRSLKKMSQPQAIATIEKVDNVKGLVNLIQPLHDSNYDWDLTFLRPGTSLIIFHRLPNIQTANDAVTWAEFALSFIQGCIACHSAIKLQEYAPNPEGLRDFLSGVKSQRGSNILSNDPHSRITQYRAEEAKKPVSGLAGIFSRLRFR